MRYLAGKAEDIRNRRGSSSVMLAMAFVAFAICIAMTIGVARKMVIGSQAETFGTIWTKAILSEYDRHLLDDYGIMAYFGSDAEVADKIDAYLEYSAAGRLDAHYKETSAELTGYELGDPDNFRKAMRQSFAGNAIESVIGGAARHRRAEPTEVDGSAGELNDAIIGNPVVLDTLPSTGASGSISNDGLIEKAKELKNSDGIKSAFAGTGLDAAFIWRFFGNNVTTPDNAKSYLRNEWEYIIKGSPSDKENLSSCRKRLFVIRNALNLAALYNDPEKIQLIAAAAELITPGPLGVATQLLIAEAWAAIETESDISDLYGNERVPVLKTPAQWKTGLDMVLSSDKVRSKLDDESKAHLDENIGEITNLGGAGNAAAVIREGLNYDEYLMLMIMAVREDVRVLRIMDLVQINMKYRYYRDFNLMEYYTGVRYTIRAEGRDHSFEDCYG